MTPQLDDLALFLRIVERGTLSAVARERNVPVSQVTRALLRLEAACGARLLLRSTHGLSLTDEGDAVLAHGRRVLDAAEALQGALSGRATGPAGWVRLSVSPVLAEAVVAPPLLTRGKGVSPLRGQTPGTDPYISSATVAIAPQGHSATHRPQPLQ